MMLPTALTQLQRHIQQLMGLPAKQKTERLVSMAMAHILSTLVAFLSLSALLVNAASPPPPPAPPSASPTPFVNVSSPPPPPFVKTTSPPPPFVNVTSPPPAASPTSLVKATSPPPAGPTPGSSLSFHYYDGLCTSTGTARFQSITDSVVAPKIAADPGLAPALMRMAFHDCMVEGCDASVMLDSTPGNVAEKAAGPNLTLRGFEVINAVKAALELICPGVFSCADILQEVALAAQRHVVQLAPKSTWPLRYGRRDGRVSLATKALTNIPSPAMNYTQLVANFAAQGLNKFDLVTLSGAHTFGVAHCITFTQRLYNFNGNGTGTDPALDPAFAASLKAQCPPSSPLNIVKMDAVTPDTFDNQYYKNIGAGKVVFTSDNALKSDPLGIAANQVSNGLFVGANFALSFFKMSEIQVKLFPNGEIRSNCALRNP